MSDTPSVAFVVRYVNQYREPFYRRLGDELRRRNVEFELIHGAPSRTEATKNDSVRPEWATFVDNRVLSIGSHEIVHQPVMGQLKEKDLVIVEQASRLVLNYRLLARRAVGRGPALAFIGHGANLASSPSRLGEAMKRTVTGRADWFFAYTEGTRRLLEASGFDARRITVFNNTLDLASLTSDLEAVTADDVAAFRGQLGIEDQPLVLTLGSLYPDKRPDLAVDIGATLIDSGLDIHLVLVGSGEMAEEIAGRAVSTPWLHHVDAAFGRDKAVALRAADVLLIPGVAGLVLLDGFAAGLPIVTATNRHHPPEIDYVVDGVNGLVAERQDAEALAAAVRSVLLDDTRWERLATEARSTAGHLSFENMITSFADGVMAALSALR